MLRKILMSTVIIFGAVGAASAADLPTMKGPPAYMPPAPPPIFTWTGVYVGGQVGYQWGTSDISDPYDYTSLSPSGVTGGAHIGYNYQFGQFVAGLEGDVNGASYHGSNTGYSGIGYSTREDIDGSIRGRVGMAWDRALIYATGGVAFANFQNTYNGFGSYDSTNTGRVGWTVGGGIEYAIDNNWSIRAEYRYTDYGHFSQYSPNVIGTSVDRHETNNKVQVGFSYKFDMFGPTPVVAKY
jgi:outer membrane immunogenic protein